MADTPDELADIANGGVKGYGEDTTDQFGTIGSDTLSVSGTVG